MKQSVKQKKELTILDAMTDPALFGQWFEDKTWNSWRVFLAALFGLEMDKTSREIYRKHTGRKTPPQRKSKEAWLAVGRRGGKSRIAALLGVYIACFRDHRSELALGEVATVMIIASDRRQARVILRYVKGFLESVPMLKRMVVNEWKEGIELSNQAVIEIHTCSFRAVRGYTAAACIADEIAFWRSEDSANPDKEILNGLRPGMATIRDALLLCISSPYARRGALWEAYR